MKNCSILLCKTEKYEGTCILHESFLSILENYLMIVRPNLQCKSPYFHGSWYFYLIYLSINLSIYLANQCNESGRNHYMVVENDKICQTRVTGEEEALQPCLLQLEPMFISPYLCIYSSDQCNESGRKHYVVVKKGAILWQSRADNSGTSLFRCWIVSLSSNFLNCRSASSKLAPTTPGGAKQ